MRVDVQEAYGAYSADASHMAVTQEVGMDVGSAAGSAAGGADMPETDEQQAA